MKKTVISRNELAKKIRELFIDNRNTQKYEKIDDNFLVNYYFDSYDEKRNPNGVKIDNFDLKIFEEDFKIHLLNEKKQLEEAGVDANKITKVVSAFSHSFSRKSILEDLPFEKDLKIFPNIETLYLLYTKETENKFLEYKENSKYKDLVIIEGILIDTSVEASYRKVVNLNLEGKISKNNTILDTTLGFKEIGIVFYKISVEKQIKSINWRETMLSNYKLINENDKDSFIIENGQGPRMSLVTKLNLMKEPLEESNRIYRKINENIMKVNCEGISDLYEIVGIEDLSFFYKEIGKLFSFFKMLEYNNKGIENFYNDLNESLEKIFKYKFLPENISKLREYIKYLLKIIYRIENDSINWLKFSNNIFGITENEVKKNEKLEEEKNEKLDENKIKEIRENDERLKNIDFYSDEDDEGKNDEILEESIDMVEYFLYLLLKQAIFENISSYYLKNILEENYEKEKIEKIVNVINSKNKSVNEKIECIKDILFEDKLNEEYNLKEFEIPSLADKNVGLLRYKGGILSIPFESEGKLEKIEINFMEEYFIRKKERKDEFNILKKNDRDKLNKKIENELTLEEILDKYDRDEIKLPLKISEKSDITKIRIQNGERKIITKSDRKTKLGKIFLNNSDSEINAPIAELFNNIEKNKFEISKKDMVNKFKIKEQKITKIKNIITGINQLIKEKIENKFEKKEIEDFIIYEDGIRINLKYR